MQISAQQKNYTHKIDSVGSVLSFICAIHCFLMPILVVVLPFAIAQDFGAEGTHTWLIISSLLLAVISVILGHKQHKNYNLFFLPAIAAILFLLAPGHHGNWGDAAYMGAAGMILVITHVINRKLCQKMQPLRARTLILFVVI